MTRLRRRLRWLKFVALMCLVWVLFVAGGVLGYAWARDEQPADAAIVMGAAVYRDRPSPVFRERINHAITLYQMGTVDAIIFTGGRDAYDAVAESEAARNYAAGAGVPAEALFTETLSTDTEGNLREASEIVARQKFSRVLIVSDPMHMRRAVTIARDLGLDAHPAPTPTTRYRTAWSNFWFWLRESYHYALYLVSSG